MPSGNTSSPPSAKVARVSVKPAPFWKKSLFMVCSTRSTIFSRRVTTANETKFNHVISAVESEILNSVCDIILRPPENDKYVALKTRLIEIHSESEASKIRTLLQGLELGDQLPSQLLTRIRGLVGEAVGELLLKSLWLGRHPSNTQTILAALSEDLTGLAAVADKINDLTNNPSVNAVTTSNTTSDLKISQPEQQVSQLSAMVSELTTSLNKRHSRSRSRHNSQHRNPFQTRRQRHNKYKEPSNGMCFYHTILEAMPKNATYPVRFRETKPAIADWPY